MNLLNVIPAIDLRNGNVVRLFQGDYGNETVYSDDPAMVARYWESQGASHIHLVDLDGAREGKVSNREAIQAIRNTVYSTLQLGGGLRSMEALEDVLIHLKLGRAILGSVLIEDSSFAIEAAKAYPNQIILGIDARDGMVATHGWLETSSVPATELLQQFESYPFAAVIYTDISRDGTLEGPNYQAQLDMAHASPFPVIASGGIGSLEHIQKLSRMARDHQEANLTGVIVGKALYEQKFTMKDALQAADW